MVKVSTSDVHAILRRFGLASDEYVPRHVEQMKTSHPIPTSILISFRFDRQHFFALFDDIAEDDTDRVIKQIRTDSPNVVGHVIKNPHAELLAYALPYKGKEVYLFAVTSNRKRLDSLLAERYAEYSRSTWQKYIKAGYVSVNGVAVLSAKADVTDTDTIAVSIPDPTDYTSESLPIVYIDDNVIVVNKPAGMLTHTKGALSDEFTVADFFRRYTTVGLDTNRPGIVHRLDRDTSGVIIGARTQEALTLLQKQFADRKTKKTYIAIVIGHLKEQQAKIDLPIGRNPSAPSTFRVDAKGKQATTWYTVLAENEKESLIRLEPVTGRTHQLRVHLAYLGVPIIGDRLYGKPAKRLYLHARQLEITIPFGERRMFEALPPPEFRELFPGES